MIDVILIHGGDCNTVPMTDPLMTELNERNEQLNNLTKIADMILKLKPRIIALVMMIELAPDNDDSTTYIDTNYGEWIHCVALASLLNNAIKNPHAPVY